MKLFTPRVVVFLLFCVSWCVSWCVYGAVFWVWRDAARWILCVSLGSFFFVLRVVALVFVLLLFQDVDGICNICSVSAWVR